MATTRSQDQTGNGNGHRRQNSDPIEGETFESEEHLIAGIPASELLESAMHFLRGNGRGVALTAVYLARRYPVPMMLAGLGYLAWKIASRRPEGVRGRSEALRARARSGASAARRRLHEGASFARSSVSAARGRAAERASEVRERATGRAAELREHAAARAAELRERAAQGRDTVTETISDHPVAVGVAALAIGALAGAMLRRDRSAGDDYEDAATDMPGDDSYEAGPDESRLPKPL